MAKGPMFVSVVERKGSNIEMCMKIGHKIMNDRRPTPGNPIIKQMCWGLPQPTNPLA